MEKDSLIHGDCLVEMQRIPDNSIDLIVTDPPYKLISGGCKGGLNIQFNKADYSKVSKGEFFEIPRFDAWIKECFRVLKNGTHFYCMSNDKNLNEIYNVAINCGFKEVNILVWKKYMHTPLPYYMKNIEFIILFRKGGARKINNMGSFALIENIKGIYGNKIHVSEKPVPLFEEFILNSSNEGDIVLDPFAGSCSTAMACINTNRHYIVFEKEKEYYDIAFNRIEEAKRLKEVQ